MTVPMRQTPGGDIEMQQVVHVADRSDPSQRERDEVQPVMISVDNPEVEVIYEEEPEPKETSLPSNAVQDAQDVQDEDVDDEKVMDELNDEVMAEDTPQGPENPPVMVEMSVRSGLGSPTAASAGHNLLKHRKKSRSREPTPEPEVAAPSGVTANGPTPGGPTAGGPDEDEPEIENEPEPEPEPEPQNDPELELENEPEPEPQNEPEPEPEAQPEPSPEAQAEVQQEVALEIPDSPDIPLEPMTTEDLETPDNAQMAE